MLANNYSFNSPGKNNQNDITIFNDDKFINLINNLSELIKTYYYIWKNNNDEILQSFSLYESNYKFLISIIKELLLTGPPRSGIEEFLEVENHLKAISPQFYSNLEKNRESLKKFIEEAKEIFKQMKYRRYEKININNLTKIKNQLNKKKYDYSTNAKHKNNMETYRINDIRNNAKYRIKDDINIINNNTFNTNSYNINNNNNNNTNRINKIINIDNLKYLITKLGEYNNIIGNASIKAKEKFIKLQNDINNEIEQYFINKNRLSFIEHNNYDNSEINNKSFNINNINDNERLGQTKKALFRDYSNNKSQSNNNISRYTFEELKTKNYLFQNQIKDYEFQIEDLKSTIEVLEKTLDDSNNKLNFYENKNKANSDTKKNNENNNSNNAYNILKKVNNNLEQKIKINESQILKFNKDILLLKQENMKYKLKISENNTELIKQKEHINNLVNELKKSKEKKDIAENKEIYIDNKNDIKNSINNSEKENYIKIIEEKKNELILKDKKLNELNEKIKKQIIDYDLRIQKLNEENSLLSQSLQYKNNEIEELNNKSQSQNIQIDYLQNIINNNEKNNIDKNNNEEEILNLKSKILEYEDKIKDNNNLIDNLNELLNKEKENVNKKNEIISKYKKDINDLNKEKENKNNIIEDNNKYINKLKEENENKDNTIEDNQKIINNLKEEITKLNNDIIIFKNQVSLLEEEKNNLERYNELNNNDKNEELEKLKNELNEKDKYINELREKIINLESQYDKLKLKEDDIITENETLSKDLNNYKNKCDQLQIDFNLKNYNLTKELNELKKKNNLINEEIKQINDLKLEKDKMLEKIKEYKDNQELNIQQIKALKEHIKEIKKKLDNSSLNDKYEGSEDVIEEYNKMRILYENELNKNKELEKKIHYKDEQMEGLKLVINKFADEREKILFKEKKKNSNNSNVNNRYNNYESDENNINNNNIINDNDKDVKNQLKEAKLIINKLLEEKKVLEAENKNIKENNKLLRSDYKSEGGMDRDIERDDFEEEYTMKKMVKAAKIKNQSEDIKIDYPGLSNIRQKYDELEERFRNLEEAVINLLNNLKCTSEIKPMILEVCNALEISDDMVKQIIKEE